MKVFIVLITFLVLLIWFSNVIEKYGGGYEDDHPKGICDKTTILHFPRFTHPCCVSNGIEMLGNVNKVFNKYNVPIWITYGTLLGFLRHKGFIPWDDDIDTLSLAEYDNIIAEKIVPELEKYGYLVKRMRGKYDGTPEYDYYTVEFSKTNNLHLDIGLCTGPVDFLTKGEALHMIDGPVSSIQLITSDPVKYKQWIHPLHDTFPLKTVYMYDIKLSIPKNAKKLIKEIYDDTCLVKAKIKSGNVAGINDNLRETEITDFSPAVPL